MYKELKNLFYVKNKTELLKLLTEIAEFTINHAATLNVENLFELINDNPQKFILPKIYTSFRKKFEFEISGRDKRGIIQFNDDFIKIPLYIKDFDSIAPTFIECAMIYETEFQNDKKLLLCINLETTEQVKYMMDYIRNKLAVKNSDRYLLKLKSLKIFAKNGAKLRIEFSIPLIVKLTEIPEPKTMTSIIINKDTILKSKTINEKPNMIYCEIENSGGKKYKYVFTFQSHAELKQIIMKLSRIFRLYSQLTNSEYSKIEISNSILYYPTLKTKQLCDYEYEMKYYLRGNTNIIISGTDTIITDPIDFEEGIKREFEDFEKHILKGLDNLYSDFEIRSRLFPSQVFSNLLCTYNELRVKSEVNKLRISVPFIYKQIITNI